MKEIKLQDKTYLFVEVPLDATNIRMTNNINIGSIVWYGLDEHESNMYIDLKTLDNYQIISATKDITEEQAESIVFKYTDYETEHEQLLHEMYEDYLEKGNYWVQDSSGIKLWAFKTAKESLQSLIQANGLDITKNYLILQKL
jgi:hypothetical protein